MPASLQDLPANVLAHVLLTSAPTLNLVGEVSTLARVCREWRQVVLGAPDAAAAYGCGWPAAQHQERARVLSDIHRALESLQTTPTPAPSPDLKRLSLYNQTVGDEGGQVLGAALRALPTPSDRSVYGTGLPLQGVYLSNASLTAAGVTSVAAGLRVCDVRTLAHLRVNGNAGLGDTGVEALASVLPATLTHLYIGTTGCGDAGMVAIAAALPATQMETLDAYDNPAIGEVGWAALGAALPQLTQLSVLGLSGCGGMGSDGLGLLAAGLPGALTTLSLASCGIGVTGIESLVTSVSKCAELQYLNLASNPAKHGAECNNVVDIAAKQSLRTATAEHGDLIIFW